MRAGPKGAVTADPLDFTGWPAGRAKRRERFISEFLITPRGVGANEPFKLRSFQQDIIRGAYAPGIRTALVSIPRANGKTMLAAGLGLAEMFVGPPSAETLVVASDQRQANITHKYAKRMVELNPVLAERVQIFADRLHLPENDATLLPLPAEPGALHGHDPSLQICDELHVTTEAVWEAVTSVAGKRPESLTLAISTPASSPDSVMWRLVQHGRRGDDPSFYFKEFAAPDGCAVDDRKAWRLGNPALACRDPFLSEDGIEAARKTIREPVFRQLRLGQWVTGVDAWLPWGAWRPARSREPCSRVSASCWPSTGARPGIPQLWSGARWTAISGWRASGRTPATLGGVFLVTRSTRRSIWRSPATTSPSWRVIRGGGVRRSRRGRSVTARNGCWSGTLPTPRGWPRRLTGSIRRSSPAR